MIVKWAPFLILRNLNYKLPVSVITKTSFVMGVAGLSMWLQEHDLFFNYVSILGCVVVLLVPLRENPSSQREAPD